jgi:retron-type reverse transcriptase
MSTLKYSYKDSPFYKLRSKAKLASLLFVSVERLNDLATKEGRYIFFTKPKKNGGVRDISAPILPLKKVQARIANLLSRIAPPDYLFAPVAGRSYVDNAARHLGARSVRLLDIKDFFPSCTINKAIWFFHRFMDCSPDVAAILARIVTNDGVLPQGSPCSPILAYLCYVDMWDEIADLAASGGSTLSVYADDLTISGAVVPEEMIWQIKRTLFRHGHDYAKEKERSKRDRPAEITGVILRREAVCAPNRQLKKIVWVRDALRRTNSPEQTKKLEAQLRGRMAQLNQINAGNAIS